MISVQEDSIPQAELIKSLTIDNVHDSLTFYASITTKPRTESQEIQIQQTTQKNLKLSHYCRWCGIKYLIFMFTAIIYSFVGYDLPHPGAKCRSGFFPLYIFGISFCVIAIITILAMRFLSMNGLSLWILNMFGTFYFMYLTFKITQCQKVNQHTCEIFKEGYNRITLIDIVIFAMGTLWFCRILLNCCRKCDCINYIRDHGLYYLLVIIWAVLIISCMTCSMWQAFDYEENRYYRIPLRIVIAISSMDTFILQTTRIDAMDLIQRMRCNKPEKTPFSKLSEIEIEIEQ